MQSDQFSDVKVVICEPLKFKLKLAIGEAAYRTLRLKNKVSDFWDVGGAIGTGAGVAKTAFVASTFFAPQGALALFGLGTAVTPVGWVVAAAVLSGGAFIGVRSILRDASGSRVSVIPKFINTPIDVLAISLFDLIAPLALKIASVDGQVTEAERKWIKDYFVIEWGYDPLFIEVGCNLLEAKLEEFSIKEVAESFAEFSKTNPDCNYAEMTRDLLGFLNGVMEADGKIDEREEFAIEKIEAIFAETGRTFSKASLAKANHTVMASLKKGKESLESGAKAIGKVARKSKDGIVNSEILDRALIGAEQTKEFTKKHTNDTIKAGKVIIGKMFK